jgi:hypothetical protein
MVDAWINPELGLYYLYQKDWILSPCLKPKRPQALKITSQYCVAHTGADVGRERIPGLI